MLKVLLFPVLLGFACVLAAAYGAGHNQISYSVSPEYFHSFKFRQFRIDPEFHNRVGTAIVGIQASWWMGVVIGLPVYFAGLFVRGTRPFVLAFLRASILVVLVTLVIGLGALAWAIFTLKPETLPSWMEGRNVTDPVAFAQAGVMHNFSYIGGQIGLTFGLVAVVRAARRSRRSATP